MNDVEIKFEREGVDGIVAVGTYLFDAAKRFGVKFDEECDHKVGVHHCALVVTAGIDKLSQLTAAETEHFAPLRRRSNERLAHEAQILKPGEIVIMTDKKKEEPTAAADQAAKDKFQADFEALPLDEKISKLLKMEVVTLSETFAYVVNSPMKVVEKVGDVLAEFGKKLEDEAKRATRPADTAPKADAGSASSAKPKGAGTRRSSPRPAAKP